MNNEIKRKITSLTLMTIMLAGGMSFAAPAMLPAAHAANANLFVSAENSQFDNYMSGPQVIEVVVIDSDINDTDELKGEPDVTVNGKILRMVQGVDGNWYGYFADRDMAVRADSTSEVAGTGLDFGTFCENDEAILGLPDAFTDTVGVAVTDLDEGDDGDDILAQAAPNTGLINDTNCAGGIDGDNTMNVLREHKSPETTTAGDSIGQIGLDQVDSFPFIQLYALNPTGNVIVQYNKGGGAQTTTLTFDTVNQFAGTSLDRSVYPQSAEVHVTITDSWLNIDPTDEDSWTFGTEVGSLTTNYQVFDENGAVAGDIPQNTDDNELTAQLSALMCDNNCVLKLNTDVQNKGDVITLQDNDDSEIFRGAGVATNPESWATIGNRLLGDVPVTITEQGPNSGVFGSYDESDKSNLVINEDAKRGTSASIDYNNHPVTILVGHNFGTIDIQSPTGEWNSGEETPVTLVDGDANQNSRADENLNLNDADVKVIPSLSTGDPFTLGESGDLVPEVIYGTTTGEADNGDFDAAFAPSTMTETAAIDRFSERAVITVSGATTTADTILIDLETTVAQLLLSVNDNDGDGDGTVNEATGALNVFKGFNFVNIDVSGLSSTELWDVYIVHSTGGTEIITDSGTTENADLVMQLIATGVSAQSITQLTVAQDDNIFGTTTGTGLSFDTTDPIGLAITLSDDADTFAPALKEAFVADLFSFGFNNNGEEASDRIANQIVRLELEETGDNTSTFTGTLEYTMINQLNILNAATYTGLKPIDDTASFIVIEDLTDEDSPRVNYLDRGADGTDTQIADQQAAPSHSGIVSFDKDSYKEADTVTVTLQDQDLNTDVDLIDIYTTVAPLDNNLEQALADTVGDDDFTQALSFGTLGRLLDITFDDERWVNSQANVNVDNDNPFVDDATENCDGDTTFTAANNGLSSTGFTLVETGAATGIFTGDFIVPSTYCSRQGTAAGTLPSVMGLDMEVNYLDFRDASGEIIEVGDGAGIRANTGSVSLDRTVYPVPFGVPTDFGSPAGNVPENESIFSIHKSGIATGESISTANRFLSNGDLTIHVRVNDPDFDLSAMGEDTLASAAGANGLVKISVIRGSSTVVLGYAGSSVIQLGTIATGTPVFADSRQFGPMTEIAPDAGIFEADVVIRYTDGPADVQCPNTTDYTPSDGTSNDATDADTERFSAASTNDYCILQGDILQVQYTDPVDASGDVNTVTDSATFDLRNGVLQSDKSVYIIGSDMILTLIEPDFDLDNDQAETYDLDLIEWDSDAAKVTMGDADGEAASFDPEPSSFRETGDSTGIFQIVIEIPQTLASDKLERGEEIKLEFVDWGPSGSNYVGDESEDVNLTIFTSNFGATVELDQKVYTWTDKVYITIVAPDHNFDSNLIDEVGNSDEDPIKVSTRGDDLTPYKLVETGTDTGIFTGEVILTGFAHDANGDGTNDKSNTAGTGSGPTDGTLLADDDDGITVSFEFSEDETIVGSALIRWNIGEVQWLEASYPASGTGVVRVIDPDMNLNPEAVDNFKADVWSDSDAGGIDLTVTETNEATGIFEGTVFFTVNDESSGHRLRVAEGDTVTAEYQDNTLPNPYTRADELDISATSLIGTIVPPLERAPAANLRTVDAFGNSLSTVSVDQQVQITADLANGQDRVQAFAYLVQIQDGNGVTVSLAWITGSLSAGQSFSPALSWIPTDAGTYTATAFVWESVDNPTALSPPVSTTITVQ